MILRNFDPSPQKFYWNLVQTWTVQWTGSSASKKIKTDFTGKSTFFELPITQKRFIFEESYISNGKRQKSCTLIVI